MTDDWKRLEREKQKLEELNKAEERAYWEYCRIRHQRVVQEEDFYILWDRLVERAKEGC